MILQHLGISSVEMYVEVANWSSVRILLYQALSFLFPLQRGGVSPVGESGRFDLQVVITFVPRVIYTLDSSL